MTSTEIAELLDETKCLACYGASFADMIKIGLLSRISGGGSGAASDSYVLTLAGGWESSLITSPATYYIGGDLYNSTRTNPSTYDNWKIRVPADGIIKTVCLHKMATALNGSGIPVQHSILINGVTAVGLMTFAYDTLPFDSFVDNIDQSVSAGDFIALRIVTGAGFGTVNGPRWHCSVLIERT